MDNKAFDDMPLPLGGAVPLGRIAIPTREFSVEDGKLRHSPIKPEYENITEKSKTRVKRNINEAPAEKLFRKGKIDQQQYFIYGVYRENYLRAFGGQSHEYKESVDGQSSAGVESKLHSQDKIIAANRLIKSRLSARHLQALHMFAVNEDDLWAISEELGYGWGERTVISKICNTLDELLGVWREASSGVKV